VAAAKRARGRTAARGWTRRSEGARRIVVEWNEGRRDGGRGLDFRKLSNEDFDAAAGVESTGKKEAGGGGA
jgi:hypothetical protein